jgi:hypothetical protein
VPARSARARTAAATGRADPSLRRRPRGPHSSKRARVATPGTASAAADATAHAASSDASWRGSALSSRADPYPSRRSSWCGRGGGVVATSLKWGRNPMGPMCTGRPAAISTACEATSRCIAIDSTSCSVSRLWNSGVTLKTTPSRSAGSRVCSRLSSVKCDRAPPTTGISRRAAARALRSAASVAASDTCRDGPVGGNAVTRTTSSPLSERTALPRASGRASSITKRTSSGRPAVAARERAARQVRVARSSSTSTAVANDGVRGAGSGAVAAPTETSGNDPAGASEISSGAWAGGAAVADVTFTRTDCVMLSPPATV